ncbi:MAG: hypothetical protein JNM17_13500 [Archangium sp.]|nr:hypothetical protein [Archangium sp.]
MNYRALTLGALVGFVVAFTPSCTQKCGPQNCDGCCDSAKNTCVKKPNNNNNTTCGSAGNACIDCTTSAATCNMGQCSGTGAGGGGGGTTGGGGGTTGGGGGGCDGCRLPTGTCVPSQSTTTSNCGLGGVSCVACATGELCMQGTCMMPPPMARVGSTCTSDMECQAGLGAQGRCKQMTSSGNATYSQGYCTVGCGTTACPAGSTCVGAANYGEDDVICMDNCTPPSDPCRSGYTCYTVGSSRACWIAPLPMRDAGVPADKVGNACTSDSECQNPPADRGLCLTREGNFDWQSRGGYCSRIDCVNDSECSADGGALCLNITSSGGGACVDVCPAASADAGQSDCRNGFSCEPLVFPDGGWAMVNVCLPPQAPIPDSIGNACMTDMDCKTPAGAIADCLLPTLPDGGPNFPGGNCSRFDCEIDEECSTDGGAICINFTIPGGGSFTRCEKRCASSTAGQSDCRPLYACEGLGLADGGQTAFGICQPGCNAPGVTCPMGQTCQTATGYCQ